MSYTFGERSVDRCLFREGWYRNVKKRTAFLLLLILLLSCTLLSGCSRGKVDLSDSKYVGTWTATDLSLGEDAEEAEGEYTMVLGPDGNGKITGGGEEIEFPWKPIDQGFRGGGDLQAKFIDDGNGGVVTTVLGVDLRFVKVE